MFSQQTHEGCFPNSAAENFKRLWSRKNQNIFNIDFATFNNLFHYLLSPHFPILHQTKSFMQSLLSVFSVNKTCILFRFMVMAWTQLNELIQGRK